MAQVVDYLHQQDLLEPAAQAAAHQAIDQAIRRGSNNCWRRNWSA